MHAEAYLEISSGDRDQSNRNYYFYCSTQPDGLVERSIDNEQGKNMCDKLENIEKG